MLYLVDIVGTCNLRCPSCPVGNFNDDDFIDEERPKGFMELDLFRKILTKIKEDNPGGRPHLHLYNWGEAFIHPQIGEFLQEISKAGLSVETSSNFSSEIDIRSIVKAADGQITAFRISLSGFSQGVYEKAHRRGSIALVKSNMHKLRHYMDLYKKDIPVYVYYHIYRDNVENEILKMIEMCKDLKFGFQAGWAYLMPIEKMMSALDIPYAQASSDGGQKFKNIHISQQDTASFKELSVEDYDVLARLAIPMDKMKEIADNNRLSDCSLRSQQTVINYDGSVPLCCGLYDPKFTIEKSFLSLSKNDLQAKKYKHQMCHTCLKNNVAQIALAHPAPAWDQEGNAAMRELGNKIEVLTSQGRINLWA